MTKKNAESRETKDKKIFEEISHKNSTTSMKKNLSPAQFGISYSTADGTIGKFDNYRLKPSFEDKVKPSTSILEIREDIDTLKKAIKELEKVEKMKIKEIETLERSMKEAKNVNEKKIKESDENISHNTSSSLVNEISSPVQNNASCSIDSDSISAFDNKKDLLKISLQDEASTSSEIDDNSSNEYERKIMQEIDDLKKALKEMEKTEEMTIKEIETLKKTHKALDNVEEMQIKEIESLRKTIKEMISSSVED
ncbi:hypothetical protein HNY73_019019 [Argiope bruennichi]|uniref:Uncharacterized protein n=1 Tax=Argiope bruennichi TaxID=94029 RepID=A0A8T0EIB1_ARGBR|nr:hypothetical protein HNY73_019019 [Argiope bruennichi]